MAGRPGGGHAARCSLPPPQAVTGLPLPMSRHTAQMEVEVVAGAVAEAVAEAVQEAVAEAVHDAVQQAIEDNVHFDVQVGAGGLGDA